MKHSSKLLAIVLVAILLPIVVSQAFAFTNTLTSPASTLVGKGTQYYIKFIEPSTFASVTELDVTFPTGTVFGAATTLGLIQGLPTAGTVATSGTSINYTFDSTSITAGTEVQALAVKVQNTGTVGAQTITYTLKNGATILDTGTAPFATQSIVGATGPTGATGATGAGFTGSNFQLNFGNTEFGSHPCSVTITQSSYLIEHEPKISMINYLSGKTAYGQLAFADGDPFVGEVELFPYDFFPTGFMHADGSLLPISQDEALFSLLGTNFGGNGINTFGLPNLQCMEPPNMEYAIATAGIFPPRP